jgi:cell division septal protein FtsQ
MAKTKKKTKPFAVKKSPMDPQAKARLRSICVNSAAAMLVISLAVVGFVYARRYVDRRIAFYGQPPKVVLKDRPIWMSDYLAEQIVATAQPMGAHSSFDHQLLVDVGDSLRANPWIKQVREVRRAYGQRPGDTIEIDCDYRTPLALVHWKDYYWLVDDEGVKLPEQFTAQQLPQVVNGRHHKLQFRIVEGVQNPPVESGRRWPGEDLASGLELARYLYAQPYAEEVVRIDVSNYAGRVARNEAQIVLLTKRNTEVRWGRPVNAKDFFVEVSVAQKLDYMRRVWQQYGQVDARQAWIDIRFDKITYPSAAPAPGTGTAAGTEPPSQARLDGPR